MGLRLLSFSMLLCGFLISTYHSGLLFFFRHVNWYLVLTQNTLVGCGAVVVNGQRVNMRENDAA